MILQRTVPAVLAAITLTALLTACRGERSAVPAAVMPQTEDQTSADIKNTATEAPPQPDSDNDPDTSVPGLPEVPVELRTRPLQNGYLTGIDNDETVAVLAALFSASDAQGAAIYCYDIDSGMVFCSNRSKQYQTQSVIKAPYIMAVLRSLGTDTERVLNETLSGGHTVRDLMESAIRFSDNEAYRTLYTRFGNEPFHALAEELGISVRLKNSPFGQCTVEEMGILFREIQCGDYPEKNFLLDTLSDTAFHFLLEPALPDLKIAHKYGLNTDTGDCHDAAIVYDTHPYIIVIFSVYDPEAAAPYAPFRALARQAAAAHDALRQGG